MIDTHCHLDLYAQPTIVAKEAQRAGVLTIAVTNVPSAFDEAYAHVRPLTNVRLALGLHPLAAEQHHSERKRFKELINRTSYIGEVGLDFSQAGFATRDIQIESFKFVLEAIRNVPKFLTVHSRRAESQIIDLLDEWDRSPVVFHWYSGSLTTLRRVLSRGHFLSVNPAMLVSPNGNKIIEALPPERVLSETDGPFVRVGNRPAFPSDVQLVETNLATRWAMKELEVRAQIRRNFLRLVEPLRPHVTVIKRTEGLQ
jgi:TatD DNase family protein